MNTEKSLRRNADDGQRMSIHKQFVANDLCVRRKMIAPEFVTDHCHRIRLEKVIVVDEEPAGRGLYAQCAEEIAGNKLGGHHRAVGVYIGGIAEAKDLGERFRMAAKITEHVQRERIVDVTAIVSAATPAVVVHLQGLGPGPLLTARPVHHVQLRRICYGQRLQQDRVNQAENGTVCANAQREREHGNDGKSRSVAESSHSISQVAEEVMQKMEAASLAAAFLVSFHCAEFEAGAAERFLWLEPATREFLRSLPDMGLDFRVQIC